MFKGRWSLCLILALVNTVFATQFGDIPVTQVIGTPSITNDSNVTLTLGGTPTDALLKPFSLTVGWSGTLPVTRGGTGAGTAGAALSALGGQPLDGDLTALAALSGTNTIYYRSGADTWTAVTMGGGMTFSGGVLNSVSGGSGTVTSFSAGDLSPLFTTTEATVTTTPALSFSLSTAAANTVFGNATASTAAPTFSSSPRFTAIGNLTTNGFVTTSGGTGTLAVDTNTYQVSDADLTSLAAASGTNTIYYRSAANTWSPVTIGGNMTFSGGTLNANSGGGAPTTATYITQTADATLSAEQALSALGTGLMKNTTGTGVISIATAGTDYLTPATGVTTFTAGSLSPLFTGSPSSATSGAITESFTLSNAAATTVFGRAAGTSGAPTYSSSPQFTAIGNLTTNGFIKTGGGVGTLSVDTNTYLTGNQSITLSGDVTGTGSTAITTAYNNAVPTTKAGVPTGGTAGQVLSKIDATNYNTQWVAQTSGGAPTTATYITQTADGTLSNEQALGALATGLLKNTTTTGVLSIATAGTDYVASVANPGGQLVGLSAINGSASTAMRSDGAPALNQAIAPTWTGQHIWTAASTIASGANATINDIWMKAATTTVTGGIPITNTQGFNKFQVDQPTITSAGAQSITNASTVFILGPPIAAGSVTITNPYSLWVDAGTVRFDGGLNLGTTATPATGVINVSSGYQLNGAEFPTAANGIVKRTAANTYAAATAGTDYEAALGNPGTNGFVLSSTTGGTRSWVAQSGGGGTPGGSNTYVQFNDSSTFGGDSQLTFDKSTGKTTFKNGLSIGIGPISSGGWIDMPTSGPSGIGTGGAGSNPWVAYAQASTQWFNTTAAGDVAYRNGTGQALWFGILNGGNYATMRIGDKAIRYASDAVVSWSNAVDASATLDLGFSRNAAGVMEINNGTAGTLRDLTLRNLTISGTCTGCGGGGGSPGGSNTQIQYNASGAFGGVSYLTYDNSAGAVTQITGTGPGTRYYLADPSDTTKKANFDLSNIATATTRTVNIPNANSTTIQPDTGSSNNFLTAVSAQGVISKAQPAFTNISGTITNTQAGVTGSVVGTSDTQTLTNKRINPRVDSSTSGATATWSPNADTTDVFTTSTVISVAVTTINNPSGTPVDGQKLMFRFKSNGSANALTWSGTNYRASTDSGTPAFPTATNPSKTTYVGVQWNATDSKWDLLAVQSGF